MPGDEYMNYFQCDECGENYDVRFKHTCPPATPPLVTVEAVDLFIPVHRGDKWYACNLARGLELAPVFDTESTAEEVGRKMSTGEAYFTHIPLCPLDTPYPRPDSAVVAAKAALKDAPPRKVIVHRREPGMPAEKKT